MKYLMPVLAIIALIGAGCNKKPVEIEANHIHFMHQSCGGNIIDDHPGTDNHPDPDYGLGTLIRNAGYTFTDEWMDDSYPTSIAELFANDGRRLSRDAERAEILLFKSCYYPIDGLTSDAELEAWKQAFRDEIIPYAQEHTDKIIVAMPAVPYREQDTDQANHDRARQWADWLADEFLEAAPSNVTSFDLFDIWADPEHNWLKEEYEGNDSHPNAYAYLIMADSIAAFIAELTASAE
ncbi:hypothetical protein JXM67_03870 [candidate division WOR-3 bacterium]|nr:hypothetical protein [candidate division WOR-3 bacterium]